MKWSSAHYIIIVISEVWIFDLYTWWMSAIQQSDRKVIVALAVGPETMIFSSIPKIIYNVPNTSLVQDIPVITHAVQ